jgi:predicted  nucleic acid-binding Zn-ribbon protein
VAENNQLAAMDNLPETQAHIDEVQARFDEQKSGVDQLCAEIDERLAVVKAELEAANAERVEKVKNVSDKQFLLYYERLRTKRWPVVVTLTHQGVCDGCHLVQPPSVSQMVDKNAAAAEKGQPQKVVGCTMCGRILYRG